MSCLLASDMRVLDKESRERVGEAGVLGWGSWVGSALPRGAVLLSLSVPPCLHKGVGRVLPRVPHV